MTRNAFALTGTRVRISPSPPKIVALNEAAKTPISLDIQRFIGVFLYTLSFGYCLILACFYDEKKKDASQMQVIIFVVLHTLLWEKFLKLIHKKKAGV